MTALTQYPADNDARFAVVVPAHNAAADIGPCLDHLNAAGFGPGTITVVDDGSADDTAQVAATRGVRVVRRASAGGPAAARNEGATGLGADIILFVDADVCVHPDAREKLAAAFADPAVDAIFGSYDDAPPHRSVPARYRNLLHHFVHQCAAEEAETFWTGLGAVRREAFEAVGGLDPTWRYLEDIEFGMRLRGAGRTIRVVKDLQGAHRKAWTLRSIWRTDLYGRAIPYSRLVLLRGGPGGDLNLGNAHKISALSVAGGLGALAVSPLFPPMLALVPAAGAAFYAANRRFIGLLSRVGGPGFAAASMPYHAVHYLAALTGYGAVYLTEYLPTRLRRLRPGPSAG